MVVTKSFRIERRGSAAELNEVLLNLRSDQLVDFQAFRRGLDGVEVTVTYDPQQSFKVIETHPRTSSVLPHTAKPSSIGLVFSSPVDRDNVSLRFDETSVSSSLLSFDSTSTIVNVDISGLAQEPGQHYLDGQVKSREGDWIAGDCMVSYSLVETTLLVPGDELPTYQAEDGLSCIYQPIGIRERTDEAVRAILNRTDISKRDIVRVEVSPKSDEENALFILYKRHNPPKLTRIEPGHGAVLASGLVDYGKVGFSSKLSEDDPVSVYINDVLVSSSLQPSGTDLKFALNTDVGTHQIQLHGVKSRGGTERHLPILSTYSVVVPTGVDLSDYYTKTEVDALIPPTYDELSDLVDTRIMGQANNDLLKWDANQGKWINGVIYAEEVFTSITNFDGVLSGSDTNVQTALETIDDHNHDSVYSYLSTATVYVAKYGDDTNDGLSIQNPKLTISAAITAGSSLIAGSVEKVNVHVLDGGTYDEDLTIPSGIHLWGPSIILVGEMVLTTGGSAKVHTHYAETTATGTVSLSGSSGTAEYEAETLDTRGTSGTLTGVIGVINATSGGILFVKIKTLYVGEDSGGISGAVSGFGHVHFKVNDLYLAGDNAIGIAPFFTGSDLIGYIDHILDYIPSSPTGTVAIKSNIAGTEISLSVLEIDADTAWNISAGEVHIVCPDVTGTRTGSPTTLIEGTAASTSTDTTDFDGVLSGTDTDVQTALETIDDHSHALGDISNITLAGPISGQVLQYDGASWINDTSPSGATTLGGLSDVTLSSPGVPEYLAYSAIGDWINQQIEAGHVTVDGMTDILNGDTTVQEAMDTLDSHTHSEYAEIKTTSGSDFNDTDLEDITGPTKEIGFRIDAGNESLQINIGGTIFTAALS